MRSKRLQSLQDRKQYQKNLGKWAEDNEHLRSVIEDSHAQMEDIGHIIQRDSVVEAELDEEIRGLQGGGEMRGSSASQSSGCCMDPAFLHSFLTSGAALARQQLEVRGPAGAVMCKTRELRSHLFLHAARHASYALACEEVRDIGGNDPRLMDIGWCHNLGKRERSRERAA